MYGHMIRRCIVCSVAGSTRRTNINLDMELVRKAADVLGTAQTTATVHAALRDVVARDARRKLAKWNLEDLTPEVLEEMRKPRTFG